MRCDLLHQMAARISQVCVESAPSLLDIDWELHAYAADAGAQQQTRRPPPPLWIDGADMD